jgi:hypothetical protein
VLQRGRGAGDLAAKPSQSEAAVAPAERATRGLARRVDSRGWRGGDYSLWSCQWVVQASRRRCTVAKARRVGSCAEEHQSRSWRRHALLATRLFALLSKWLKTSSRSLPRLASKFERHSISGGVASALASQLAEHSGMHGPDETCAFSTGVASALASQLAEHSGMHGPDETCAFSTLAVTARYGRSAASPATLRP